MKSLAIAGLALLAGSVTARSNVQGNNNHGILGVDASGSQLRNNHGIINVFGQDGNHNAPGNKGFINVLPFHIVRDDDDDELFNLIHVDVDNQKYNVHHNSGRVTINADDDELFNNYYKLDLKRKDFGWQAKQEIPNFDDEELFAMGNINISGNQGKVHFNTDTLVEQMKNIRISKNHGQITQTDSTGKTTIVDGGKSDSDVHTHPRPHHPRDTHPGKPNQGNRPHHPHVHPGKPVKPTQPIETHPGKHNMTNDIIAMNLAMEQMRLDMQPMKETRGFLAN